MPARGLILLTVLSTAALAVLIGLGRVATAAAAMERGSDRRDRGAGQGERRSR